MTIQTVKLSQLRLSPLNVRRVKPKAIDQLAADIAAHGLLQNLVVYAEGDRFAVAAGGRRYRALKQLEKAKTIPSCHLVAVDVRDKAQAIELSLAENVSREVMHSADAVFAYGALYRDGLSPEDIAARFGVALSYVTKILRLAALCPEALKCFARDEIGMEAAQALTLTDDHDRQREALKRCGNQAHYIRRMLTSEKIGTDSNLFLFVGYDSYLASGGTITADLFATNGDGYADDPTLVEALATAKLDAIAATWRAEGWQDVRPSFERPHDYYSVTPVHPAGQREPTDAEQGELDRIEAASAMRIAELGEDNMWGDETLDALRRDARRIEQSLPLFTDEQKMESAVLLYIGNGGSIEAKAIRTKRAAKAPAHGIPAQKSDYSGAMIETLSRIKTLAVQQAVASNPALALDILLDCLVSQIVHDEPGYDSPLSLRLERINVEVPDEMMTMSSIASVDDIAATDFAAIPEHERFAAIQAMDADAKGRLLAFLVASQINGGQAPGTLRDTRHHRFDRIAYAAGIDVANSWQAPVAFYDRLQKPAILKIMAETLGQAAADNCAKMKKHDLAVAAAERMAGRGWLPQPLRISEPEPEPAAPAFEHGDNGDDDDWREEEEAA
jgi:ParB family transcriptional regulator, chromosome partitioning protein